jgi:hypothetical protein
MELLENIVSGDEENNKIEELSRVKENKYMD